MGLSIANEKRLRQLWANAPLIDIAESEIEPFLQKIKENGDCWIWQASTRHKEQSGQFNYKTPSGDRKAQLVHRIMYQLEQKKMIDRSIEIYQTCTNTLCLRPDHLRERRGRNPRGPYKSN